MRIISGTARGTKINTIESSSTRPTLDRVRESLFNIIQNRVKNAMVLDLFAGSGALGIESLSRGATRAVLCDNNLKSIEVIKQNLLKTHFIDKAQVVHMDFKKCIKNLDKKFDIIFIDPPYKADLAVESTKDIIYNNLLNDDGIIIIETDELDRDVKELEILRNTLNNNLHIIDKRKYGRANLLFLSLTMNEEK